MWDESLYAGSAPYYAEGRLPYPPAVADILRDRLGLDGHGRLLDLGCGPGSLTLMLAPWYAEVVAVDADREMLHAGEQQALEHAVANIRWVHSRAEALPADLGVFDTVTLAQSFHWMDQPVVADAIVRLLTTDGCCVHVGATTHEGERAATGLHHPLPPREEIAALVRNYLGPRRRAGKGVVPDVLRSDEDVAFRAAGLHGPDLIDVPAGRIHVRSEDQVVASVLSLSSAAPHLFGDDLERFLADLRALLRSASWRR